MMGDLFDAVTGSVIWVVHTLQRLESPLWAALSRVSRLLLGAVAADPISFGMLGLGVVALLWFGLGLHKAINQTPRE